MAVSCPHTSRLPILCQHLLLAAVSYECDSRINKDFNGLTNCSGKEDRIIQQIHRQMALLLSRWCGKCVKRRGRKSRAYSAREWPVTGQWLFFSSLDSQLVILQGLQLSCQLSLQPLLQSLQVRLKTLKPKNIPCEGAFECCSLRSQNKGLEKKGSKKITRLTRQIGPLG